MSSKLNWRDARRGDRPILQGFTCCAPGSRPRGGEPGGTPAWESYVDRIVHKQTPPAGPFRAILLGFLDAVLAAVVLVEDVREAPEFFHIGVIAVSHVHRGTGSNFGDEALEHALYWAAERGRLRGLDQLILTANIHTDNETSKKCFGRAGFTPDAEPFTEDYEQWLLVLEI